MLELDQCDDVNKRQLGVEITPHTTQTKELMNTFKNLKKEFKK